MKAFVGQCEALVNQASEMQVVVLRHAAGDDDEMLAKVAVGELASQGQIEAVVEHFRPEAAAGDVGAMKAMFYALMTVGGREASAEGMRLLGRLAEGGDAWAVATRERARAYEREHARVGSATGFGPGFDRATAAFAAANGEQIECFAGYCDPEGYQFSFDENKLVGLGEGPDLTDLTVLGTYSHSSRTWLWMWANESWGWDWSHPALRSLRRVHDLGVEQGIPEFSERGLDLSDLPDPHSAASVLAISTGGLLGVSGVWSCRINDGEGSIYVHSADPRIPRAAYDRSSVEGLLHGATRLYPHHQREVVRGYFGHHGMQVGESIDRITATGAGEPGITVRFDAANQVTAIG
ncbi:DUF6882 domain-containing protein [Catenulispora acidiphila]|uniref:DUF6882 domain-containing protein n=1 Tax=Catenulispora acidiphila TaxID=304895 RepID=UPI00019DFCF3|nr:DUF6882 domain-containing protein [Catenulispora acidiphila]